MRYLLLLASLLLRVGIFLFIMNLKIGRAQPPHGNDETGFVDEMKVPARPVVTRPLGVSGGASTEAAPSLVSGEMPPPSAISVTSAPTPSFNVPLVSTGTLNSMTQALNNLTAAERGGNGAGLGQGVNIGGVTVNGNERLGVVLDVSGSMTSILPPIRHVLADSFAACPVTEAANSYGRYMQEQGEKKSKYDMGEKDLYECCYNLMDQQVSAIYMFTDFEDGENKKSTEALVEDMKKAGVKLYICFTEGPPYDKLVEYSRDSGGECKKFVPEQKQPTP